MYNNYEENTKQFRNFFLLFSIEKNIKGNGHAVALYGRW